MHGYMNVSSLNGAMLLILDLTKQSFSPEERVQF